MALSCVPPATHLLRKLDALLDLDLVRKRLEPFYSEMGRPSVDPELMIRMLLIGYCYSIRSERRLCDEVRFNLAYRWFCGLGLEAAVPHHSTFSVTRHGRFRESDAFRLVFENVVARCMKVGRVGGEGFAVDASVVEADASRYQRVEGSEVDWSDEQKAQRPVREYLAALESENSPVNPGQAPKAMSPSDPAAAWTTRGRHKVQFAYSVNHLVDLLNGVIVDVEATPTRISMEVDAVETMLDRVAARFDLKPERITADVAYGTGDLLGEIVARNIAPHIPVCSSPVRKATTPVRDQRAPTNSSAWAGAARACPRPAVARPASVGTVTNSHRVAPGGSPDAWQALKLRALPAGALGGRGGWPVTR